MHAASTTSTDERNRASPSASTSFSESASSETADVGIKLNPSLAVEQIAPHFDGFELPHASRLLLTQDQAPIAQIVSGAAEDEGPRQTNTLWRAGDNVRLSDNAAEFISVATGHVVIDGGTISVVPLEIISAESGRETTGIDAEADVLFRGNVRGTAAVISKRSVFVTGNLETANVQAGKYLIVRNGISGEGKEPVHATEGLTAAYCHNAYIICGGSVNLSQELIDSRVHSESRIAVVSGGIVGGHTFAKLGLEARVLGSPNEKPTLVRIGPPAGVLRKLHELDRQIPREEKDFERLSSVLQPLMSDVKRLAPDLREKATELLWKAEQLKAHHEELKKEHTQLAEQCAQLENTQLIVHVSLHPGVTISIGDHSATVTTLVDGPLQVRLRKSGYSWAVVVTQTQTGKDIPLRTDIVNPADIKDC